ncbi:UBX domain protein [Ancylostoma caninum]|uniref:UBX domain-containing protein 4 n=1 Tax=Ancylostoma caninum TaxID=29170 RepID=A0A368GU23_ANCCA|nr:UBX domain protein [Ancylostoma caninum]
MEGDEAAKQFAQIYPTPVLPASYVIDNLGKPIEIITLLKDIDYDEFFSKLNNAVKVFIASRKATASNGPIPESSGDQELIEAAAQRRRDKIEAEKERERLKAQIKADREEREFRERRGRPVDIASAGDMPTQPAAPRMEPVPSDRCRVQVRLPNGENIVEEFPSSDCLSTLTELIKQDGRVGGAFSIAQVYPRKVFTDEDMEKSFLELCLTPTCTLLVLQSRPKTSQIVAASPLGGIFSLFSMLIIAPLQYIYNVIAGFLGWNSGSDASTTSQARQDEAKRQRDPHSSGATVRRRGNVTRLHNTNDDSDDENANWNGNSTQFL